MRTHNTPRLCAGPQTAGTPIKFWNVASIGDDEGEITLYGDVVSRQPVDWWTGEPEPGLYIAPESFMEDLAAVKGKSNITIKINSCGGDLYTGIAIHNAIRGLTGHKVVVVEGIAASAASVIACAGDEVQVYPGSMVMIHGVAGLLYDYYTLADLKKLQKDFDASERAIAEIYHAKTGLEVDQLRSMMTRETWMVGQEAIDNGFADTLLTDERRPRRPNDRKRQRPESVPVKISRSSPFRARRQPSPSARRRPGPCSASLTHIVTGICTRPSTTLQKSNTRRRTSSPVRGSTRSSTEEVSSMAAKKRRRKRKKKIEASKKLAYWAASVATLSAASSLLLSAFGRDPVGELTGTIFTACVGYLITYAGKSLGEKISRNRHGLDADGNPLPDPSGDTLNNEEAKG